MRLKVSNPSSWLSLSGGQSPSRSPPRVSLREQKTLRSPRKFQRAEELSVRHFSVSPVPREVLRVLRALSGTQSGDYIYIYYFLMMPQGVCAGPCALERPPLCPLTHLTWSGPRGPPSPYHAPYNRSSPPKRPNPLWVRVGLPAGAFFWNVNYAMSWPSPRPEGKARGPLSAENVDGAWTDGRESHTHAQKPVRRSGRSPGGVGGARGEGQTGLPGPPYASAQHQKRRVPNSNFDGTITEV